MSNEPVVVNPLERDFGGRPSKYQPEYADQAHKLCLLGATDSELADFFEVCEATINNWKNDHPGFLESIRAGKIKADAEVAHSLYKCATGHHFTAEKVVKNGDKYEAVRYQAFLPGDPTAAFKWLLNRRGKDWREHQKIDLTGTLVHTVTHRIVD